MALVVAIIIICIGVAAFLIMALIRFYQMGQAQYDRSRRKARELMNKNQLVKAERILSTALKNIGWDYNGLQTARQAKKIVSIEQLRTFWHSLGASLNFIPKSTIEWAVPGLMLLGEIYERKDQYENAYLLYDSVFGYMQSEEIFLSRVSRSRASVEMYAKQRDIDIENNNLLNALKNHASNYLESVRLAKLENNEIEFNSKFPYQGDRQLKELLSRMNHSDQQKAICDILNRAVNVDMGRVHLDRAQREINNLFMGRKTFAEKNRDAAREVIQSVLERAAEKDMDEDGAENSDDDDIILL